MESDRRYYWRRASEELYAAARAVTPAAQQRRRELAESYVRKLKEISLGATDRALPAMFGVAPLPPELDRLLDDLPEWPLPTVDA